MAQKNPASNVTLSKQDRIKKEIRRLTPIFKDLDENKKKIVKSLIENAAYMIVTLDELQQIINEKGYSEEYQNGNNQSGLKEIPEVKTHLAMTKNHAMVLKMLADLAPPARKKSKLEAMRNS